VTVHPVDHAGLEILPFADCLRLLDSVPVGRVGFLSDGEIVILPVNHLTDGPDVIFRTGSGSKLSSVGSKNLIGFEAASTTLVRVPGWPAVISGFTGVMESDAEIERFERLGLQSWGGATAGDPHWVRIRPTSVTGRRTPGTAFG
jgi:hypothetical protein